MNETLDVDGEQVGEDFRSLIDLAPDAVFVAGRDGQLVFVNDAACAMSGWSRSQLLGRPMHRLIALKWPGSRGGPEAAWQPGRLDAAQSRLRCADGSSLTVQVTA